MNRKLICYFSCSGNTKKVAENIKEIVDGNLFEIEPVDLYTEEDLDWTNDNSRSSLEMKDKNCRPKIKNKLENLEYYDTIILGFPIWWYTYPSIISTFLEENDLSGKKIYVYATSGSSTVDSAYNNLVNNYPNLNFISGIRLTPNSNEGIDDWLK